MRKPSGRRVPGDRTSAARDIVFALYCRIASHHVRACSPGILNLLLSIGISVPRPKCARMLTWDNTGAGILLAKLWDWHLTSFVRSEGEFLIPGSAVFFRKCRTAPDNQRGMVNSRMPIQERRWCEIYWVWPLPLRRRPPRRHAILVQPDPVGSTSSPDVWLGTSQCLRIKSEYGPHLRMVEGALQTAS
jgi:hypothetical protein